MYFSALHRNHIVTVPQGSLLNSVRREYSTFFTQGMFTSLLFNATWVRVCDALVHDIQRLVEFNAAPWNSDKCHWILRHCRNFVQPLNIAVLGLICVKLQMLWSLFAVQPASESAPVRVCICFSRPV